MFTALRPLTKLSSLQNLGALVGAALIVLTTAGSASAAPQLYAQANGTGTYQTQTLASGTASAASTNSYISSGVPFFHEESAAAAFGILRASVEASAGSNGGGDGTFGNAIARFEDDFLFTAEGMEGESGLYTFLVDVDGTLSSNYLTAPLYEDSQAYAYASLSVLQNGSGVYSATMYEYANGATTGTNFLDAPVSISVPFIFGTPFTLRVGLQVQTTAYALFGGESVADFDHTLVWGGVASVTSGGNPVTGYSLSSTSGTNYLSPIPEPTSAALIVLTGLVIGFRRSRSTRAAT